MKPVKVLIYFLVLVALGTYVYLVEIKHKAKVNEAEKQAKKIVHLAKDKVTGVELIHGDQTKVKVEKHADKWVLSVPVKTMADKLAMNSLLSSFVGAESEKVIQDKDVKWDEYGLDKPEFTVVCSTKDKEIKLLFGAANPSKTSYYVRVDDQPKLYLVADTLKNSLNKSAFDVRDKSVFGIAETDVEKIVIAGNGKDLELVRKTPDKWVAVKPETFTVKRALLMSDLRTLTNLKATQIIDEPVQEGDPYGLDKPEETILMSGPKLEQTLELGKVVEKKGAVPQAQDRYGRIKGDKTVYLIDGRTLKALKTDPAQLRDRAVLSFNPADIDRFQISLDGKEWVAAHDKDNHWIIEKPEKKTNIDAWAVTGVLWSLKDLEWKSLTRPIPDKLETLHLDKPGLVVTLFKKGDKEPVTLKAGWEPPPSQPTAEANKEKSQNEKPVAGSDKAKTPEADIEKPAAQAKTKEAVPELPPAPAVVNALAQPADEHDAVFVLDGSFLTRLRGDLQRWAEHK